jgi:hypothetical protein
MRGCWPMDGAIALTMGNGWALRNSPDPGYPEGGSSQLLVPDPGCRHVAETCPSGPLLMPFLPVPPDRVRPVRPDLADGPRTKDQKGLTAFRRSGP